MLSPIPLRLRGEEERGRILPQEAELSITFSWQSNQTCNNEVQWRSLYNRLHIPKETVLACSLWKD